MVLAISGLNKVHKNGVKDQCTQHGISLDNASKLAKDVSYLLMPELKVTAKTVTALAKATPIVTIEWLKTVFNMDSTNFELPNAADFLPETGPEQIPAENFLPKPERASLFQGKVFLTFFEAQRARMYDLVHQCKGTIRVVHVSPGITADTILEEARRENGILLAAGPSEESQELGYETTNGLAELGQKTRLINEQEVAHAVVHNSTEQDGNPDAVDPINEDTQTSVGPPDRSRQPSVAPTTQSKAPSQRAKAVEPAAGPSTPAGPSAAVAQLPPVPPPTRTEPVILAPATQTQGSSAGFKKVCPDWTLVSFLRLTSSSPLQPLRTTKKLVNAIDFLDSVFEEDELSYQQQQLQQTNAGSQSGSGSAPLGTQSKRRLSQEDSTTASQRSKKARTNPMDLLDDEEEPAPTAKPPTATNKKIIHKAKPAIEEEPEPEPKPGTQKPKVQQRGGMFSQGGRRAEESGFNEVEMADEHSVGEWKEISENHFEPPKPGDPGFAYVLQDPVDDEKDTVPFDDINPGKGKKAQAQRVNAASSKFKMGPEGVAKMAKQAVQMRLDDNKIRDGELTNLKIRVVFGAKVLEPTKPDVPAPPPAKKGRGKGKEKEVVPPKPNFKRFRKVG
jgi:hypothetical protein